MSMQSHFRSQIPPISILLALASLAWSEAPVILYSINDSGKVFNEAPAQVMVTAKPIDSVNCRLWDFRPDEAIVTYMLNFGNVIRVENIDEQGRFRIFNRLGDAPFLEGCNTLSITSTNRVGLTNRQTCIIKMYTTGPRVDVMWPWVGASIKEKAPTIIADIYTIYDESLTVDASCVDSISVNGNKLTDFSIETVSGGRKRIGNPAREWKNTGFYRFVCPVPHGILRETDDSGQPFLNTVVLTVTPRDVSSGKKAKSFTNCWTFHVDTEAPKMFLDGPTRVSPRKHKDVLMNLRVNDNLSSLSRDLTIEVLDDKGNVVANQYHPWHANGNGTFRLPLIRQHSLAERIFFFWKGTESPLGDGAYTLRATCRDMTLLNQKHAAHEYALQMADSSGHAASQTMLGDTLFEKPDSEKARVFISNHWEADADPRLNVGEALFTLRVDSRPPVIADVQPDRSPFTSFYARPGIDYDSLTVTLRVNEPAFLDVCFRLQKGEGSWVTTLRKRFWALDVNGDSHVNSQDQQAVGVNFRFNSHALSDGRYDIWVAATDSAANDTTFLFKDILLVDRTGPVITRVYSPVLELNDAKLSEGIPFGFRAYDSVGGQTLALGETPRVLLKQRDNGEGPGTNVEINTVRPDSFGHASLKLPIERASQTQGKSKGVHDLTIFARDHYVVDGVDISNESSRNVEFIYGAIPPRITHPMAFAEVSGTVVIKGRARDPDITNRIPFGHFELQFAVYNAESGELGDLQAASIRVPSFYGHSKGFTNTGCQEVTEGKVLGYWDTRDPYAKISAGYYAIVLTAYEKGYDAEQLSDTAVVYVRNHEALQISGSPRLRIECPRKLDFTGQNAYRLGFSLADPEKKAYTVRFGITGLGRHVRDTVYAGVSSGGVPEGRPGSVNVPGIVLWREGGKWFLRWNDLRNREALGILQGNGAFSIVDSSGADISCVNNPHAAQVDQAMLSSMEFRIASGKTFLFTSTAVRMELRLVSPGDLQKVRLGATAHDFTGTPVAFVAGQTPPPWLWDGKDAFGTYPPPGKYRVFAMVEATDGLGYCDAADTVEIKTPFGVKIDHISSDHFYRANPNPDYVAMPDSVTAWYQLFSDADVTVHIINPQDQVIATILRDKRVVAHSDKAGKLSVSWRGNAQGELVSAGGRYRFVVRVASPSDPEIEAADTSEVFTVRVKETPGRNPSVASIRIVPDQVVGQGADAMKVVGGRDDFLWMARAKGQVFPNRRFTFRAKLEGEQQIQTAGFTRHTVKIRRWFDTVRYRVGVVVHGKRKRVRANETLLAVGAKLGSVSMGPAGTVTGVALGYAFGKKMETGDFLYAELLPQTFVSTSSGKGLPKKISFNLRNQKCGKYGLDWGFQRFGVTIFIFPPYDVPEGKGQGYYGTIDESAPEGPGPLLSDWKTKAWEVVEFPGRRQWGNAAKWVGIHNVDGPGGDAVWIDGGRRCIAPNGKAEKDEYYIDGNNNGRWDKGEKATVEGNGALGQFEIMVKRSWCDGTLFDNPTKRTFHFRADIRLKPSAWDNAFGQNNLVCRYSTWDSDNALYYPGPGDPGGIINNDGFDNDCNGLIDDTLAWDAEGKIFLEADRKHASMLHHQAIKLSSLTNAPAKRPESNAGPGPRKSLLGRVFQSREPMNGSAYGPPLKFYALEEHAEENAVNGEHWDIWLEGHSDAGLYLSNKLRLSGFSGQDDTIVSARVTGTSKGKTEWTQSPTIVVNGEAGEASLEFWPDEPVMASQGNWLTVPWPLTFSELENMNNWRNAKGAALLNHCPPGVRELGEEVRQRVVVPDSSVEFSDDDSAKVAEYYKTLFKSTEGALDFDWGSQITLAHDILDTSGTLVLGNSLPGQDGKASYDHIFQIEDEIGNMVNVKSVRILPGSDLGNVRWKFVPGTEGEEGGHSAIRFSPAKDSAWSSSDDPLLAGNGGEEYDSLDNDGDLLVDEETAGVIRQATQYADGRGFRTRKTVHFSEGYPDGATTGSSVFRNDCRQNECNLTGNDTVAIAEWDVSIRDISGKPNGDYEILSTNPNPDAPAMSSFTTKLVDDVFFPKRLVPVHGIARGKGYRIYFRNGNGWDRIAEVASSRWDGEAGERVLGFWDVTGLNGKYTLVLEATGDDGDAYQDETVAYVGQYVDNQKESILYGQNGRTVMTLQPNTLPGTRENHIVTFSAIHLDEAELKERPKRRVLGPVIRVLPGVGEFPESKKPKVDLYFTGSECANNGWLRSNFSFYSIGEEGTVDPARTSVVSYLLADDEFKPGTVQLNNADAFAESVEQGTESFMKISATLDHWSHYGVAKREPRKICVDAGASTQNADGTSWGRAYPTIQKALDEAMFGDSVLVASGSYRSGFTVGRGIHLRGGFSIEARKWQPTRAPAMLSGKSKGTGLVMAWGATVSGFKVSRFQTGIRLKGAYARVDHCLLAGNTTGILADGSSRLELLQSTIVGSQTGTWIRRGASFQCTNSIILAGKPIKTNGKKPIIATSWPGPDTRQQYQMLFQDNSLYRLKGISAAVDSGTPLGQPFVDEAPDLGWHEYIGDTLYVNELLPTGKNDGTSWGNALVGKRAFQRAVQNAAAHDRILVAGGEYQGEARSSAYLAIQGGYDPKGNGRRKVLSHATNVWSPLVLSGKGARISGLVFRRIRANAIHAIGLQNLLVAKCRFIEMGSCIRSEGCKNVSLEHNVAAKAAFFTTGSCDSLWLSNNTVAYGVSGVSVACRKTAIQNTIFYNLSKAPWQAGRTVLHRNNCFWESKAPANLAESRSISDDPLFSNPQANDFFLDTRSPCLNAGQKGRHIGAFGAKARGKTMEITCMRVKRPVSVDGYLGMEWAAADSSVGRTAIPACGEGNGDSRMVTRFAYDFKNLYGIVTVAPQTKAGLSLFFVPAKGETLRIEMDRTIKGLKRPGFLPGLLGGKGHGFARRNANGQSVFEFSLEWKSLGMGVPTRGQAIPLNAGFGDEQGRKFLWTGGAGCKWPPSFFGRLLLSDKITPIIQLQGVEAYNNQIVRPQIEFRHLGRHMETNAYLDGRPFKNGEGVYGEGRHRLRATINTKGGLVVADTILSFVVDYGAPGLSVHGIPPHVAGQGLSIWDMRSGGLPIARSAVYPRIDARDQYGLARVRASLNGADYPQEGRLVSQNGAYRFFAEAEDSSGNRTVFESSFVVDRNDLQLEILSPVDEFSTRNASITVTGKVNEGNTKVELEGGEMSATVLDSLFTMRDIPLKEGLNELTFVAHSNLRRKASTPVVLNVTRDTAAPAVSFVSPTPHDTIMGSHGTISNVALQVTDDFDRPSELRVGVNGFPATFDMDAQQWIAEIIYYSENANYTLVANAVDRAGNQGTAQIQVVFGSPPTISIRKPGHYSSTNDSLVTITGACNDSNTSFVHINSLPVDFFNAVEDTFYHALPVHQGADTFVIRAVDEVGFEDTDTLVVFVDRIPPDIRLVFPTADISTQNDTVLVMGECDDPLATTAVGSDTLPNCGTSFTIRHHLSEGLNLIFISAWDSLGNTQYSDTIEVEYRRTSKALWVNGTVASSGDGSLASPYKTIVEATSAADSGHVVYILPATYTENVDVPAGVTISGTPGVVVQPLNTSTPTFILHNADVVKNLRLNSGGMSSAMQIQGGNVTVEACSLGYHAQGIAVDSAASLTIQKSRMHNNTLTGISMANVQSGRISECKIDGNVSWGISAVSSAVPIERNIVSGNGLAGVQITTCGPDLRVAYNTLDANGVGVEITSSSPMVKANIVHKSTSMGIRKDAGSSPSVTNNDVWGSGVSDYDGFAQIGQFTDTLFLGDDAYPHDAYGNFSLDPDFMSTLSYIPLAGSPCWSMGESGGSIGRWGMAGTVSKRTAGKVKAGDLTWVRTVELDGSPISCHASKNVLTALCGDRLQLMDIEGDGLRSWQVRGEQIRVLASGNCVALSASRLTAFDRWGNLLAEYPVEPANAMGFSKSGAVTAVNNRSVTRYDVLRGTSAKSLALPKGFGKVVAVADMGEAGVALAGVSSVHCLTWSGQTRWVTPLQGISRLSTTGNGMLVALSRDRNCLQLLDASGNIVATVGQLGTGRNAFHRPSDVSVSEEGHVVVADAGNNRIVFLGFGSSSVAAKKAAADSSMADLQIANPRLVPSPYDVRKGSARFCFDLNGQASIVVKVFDANRRLVRSLDFGRCPQGQSQLPWNGKNHQGQKVMGGPYLYHITATANGRTAKARGRFSVR